MRCYSLRCFSAHRDWVSPAFSSLRGYLQPQRCPEKSASVRLTSPVRDVCAVKTQTLFLVKNERVLQQVLWDKSVSTQDGEDKEQRAAHLSCIRASATVPRFFLLNRFQRNNLLTIWSLLSSDKWTGLTGRDWRMSQPRSPENWRAIKIS